MKFKRILLATCMTFTLFLSSSAFASGGIFYSYFTFTNPAALSLLLQPYKDPDTGEMIEQHQQLAVGSENIWAYSSFQGTSGPASIPRLIGTGTVSSTDYNPLFSFAYDARFNDQWAFGVNVGHPFQSRGTYPSGAFTQYATTIADYETWDISPSLSYQPYQWISVGAGPDVERLWATIANVIPLPPTYTSNYAFNNRVSDWGYGWHAGVLVHPALGTYIGLYYYSKVVMANLTGPSTLTTFPSTTLNASTAVLPANTTLNLFQAFTKEWGIVDRLDYTTWSNLKTVTFNNNAIGTPVSVIFDNGNTWQNYLGVRYSPPKWVINAGAIYEMAPAAPGARRILQPENSHFYALGIDAERRLTKHVKVAALYAHTFTGKVDINNTQNGLINQGVTTAWDNYLDFRLILSA